MTVAVKEVMENTARKPFDRLAVDSLLGVGYVLVGIWTVFFGLSLLWWDVLGFSDAPVPRALLILAMTVAAGGFVFGGVRLAKAKKLHEGFRAGIFLGLVGLLAAAGVTSAIGSWLEARFGLEAAIGGVITAAVGVGQLVLLARLFLNPNFEKFLVQVEQQGWFSLESYKATQGRRVRRGTLLGILLVAGCGIYSLIAHQTLVSGPNNNWTLPIPFSDHRLLLLWDVQFTVPILLALASLWFAYRVVNFPTFADFLIATEAEINKVSWTTRKRLVQDTIVVLVTVILMTVFLFVVDMFWGKALEKVGVLHIKQATSTEQKESPW